jgi:hypothetical protein
MESILPFMIPIIVFMIPIIAILTSHQQKMAQIIHDQQKRQADPEIAALRQEVRELKELVHQQLIAMDSQVRPGISSVPPSVPESVRQSLP